MVLLASAAANQRDVANPVQMSDWQPFFARGAIDEAQNTCEGWLSAPAAQTRAEAHKCLANVELARVRGNIGLEKVNDDGSGRVAVMREALEPEATKKAVAHLNLALKLAPGDVSIHQGRLHMLSSAGLYDMMLAALDESAGMYRVGDTVGDIWLGYFADLFNRGAYKRAIEYLTVLYKHFPSDHRVVGNLSALYLETHDYAGALPWARKATALAPRDVIDSMNLARIQHKLGKLDAARREYELAMTLQADEVRRVLVRCWYADLLAETGQRKQACRLQREAGETCPATACPEKGSPRQ